MKNSTFNYWWLVALKGVLNILFGIVALVFPFKTFLILMVYFGALTVLSGLFILWVGWRGKHKFPHWRWIMATGFVELLFGAMFMVNPTVTATLFDVFLAAWLVLSGILQIWYVLRYKSRIVAWGFPMANGLLLLLIGLLLAVFPYQGIMALAKVLGIIALFYGLMLLVSAWQWRRIEK